MSSPRSDAQSTELKTESSHPTNESTVDPRARMYGTAGAGFIESLTMFGFDKFKNRRQMGLKEKSISRFDGILKTVVAPNYKDLSSYQRVRATFQGLLPYGLHKVGARCLVLGFAQPFFLNAIRDTSAYSRFCDQVGKENGKIAAATVAGGAAGVTEVSLNLFDRWKLICQQKNISAGAALGIMRKEGLLAQYAGAKETAYRNFPGTAALFGGKFAAYKLMGVKDHNKPTPVQSLISSLVGAWLRIAVSHLPDVAKVRAQKDPSIKMGLITRLANIAKTEGTNALVAGLWSKMVASGVKLALAVSLVDMFVKEINDYLKKEKIFAPKSARRPALFTTTTVDPKDAEENSTQTMGHASKRFGSPHER